MAFEILDSRVGGAMGGSRSRSRVMDFFKNLPPMEQMRSEEMSMVQLIIPAESAYLTVTYLGELGLLQLKDLNADKSPFQRTYANQVKRCAEMTRKLRFFREQINKSGLCPTGSPREQATDFDELEVQFGEYEAELQEINENSEKLQRTYNELLEFKLVLQKVGFLLSTSANVVARQTELDETSYVEPEFTDSSLLLEQEAQTELSKQVRLGFICGLVPKAKAIQFERILFRATRGNMLFKHVTVEEHVKDPVLCEMVHSDSRYSGKIV